LLESALCSHLKMHHECVIIADAPAALVELCGISVIERLLRILQRCQLTRAIILTSTPEILEKHLSTPSPFRTGLSVNLRGRPVGPVTLKQIVDVWPDDVSELLVLPGDAVFDSRLPRLIDDQDSSIALVDSGVSQLLEPLVAAAPNTKWGKLCGPALIRRDWAADRDLTFAEALGKGLEEKTITPLDVAAQDLYSTTMRRELPAYWFPAPSITNKPRAERVILDSAQKGTLDFPALIHGPIETFIVARLCKTSITPNQLTILGNIAAWMATVLFATGQLVWGTALALIVGVLDGLDGKQARVKVETSKAGKLEHWFDSVFEISWWTALAYHLQSTGQLPGAYGYLLLLLSAEALDLIAKGGILFRYGRLIDELGPFDRFIRLIGGRRNVYVWILAIGVFLGNPVKAFVVIAWWESITAAIHLPRAAWALWVKRYQFPGKETFRSGSGD
jgi:1L-myo-inositol 1-phosphate cytidylyltransferase / CDP-L-myo-inositol myo-inositolphosphotransferase